MIDPDSCDNSNPEPGFIAFAKDSNYESEVFSMFLAVYMSWRTVQYNVVGCSDNGYPQLKHIKTC
jgi:hypothetical protein